MADMRETERQRDRESENFSYLLMRCIHRLEDHGHGIQMQLQQVLHLVVQKPVANRTHRHEYYRRGRRWLAFRSSYREKKQ